MIKIGLLSDTHSYLSPKVFTHFKEVDEIWHAGDIGDASLANQLEDFKPFRAVWGNIDGQELRKRYEEHAFFIVDKLKVYMTHIGGYPPRYNPITKPIIQKHRPDLFISGHSHILKVMPDPALNLLHMNPGACGQQGWHKVKTLITFEIHEARINNLKVIELEGA